MPKRELAIDIILDAKRAERNLSAVHKQLNKLAKLELGIDNATIDKELQKVEKKIRVLNLDSHDLRFRVITSLIKGIHESMVGAEFHLRPSSPHLPSSAYY